MPNVEKNMAAAYILMCSSNANDVYLNRNNMKDRRAELGQDKKISWRVRLIKTPSGEWTTGMQLRKNAIVNARAGSRMLVPPWPLPH